MFRQTKWYGFRAPDGVPTHATEDGHIWAIVDGMRYSTARAKVIAIHTGGMTREGQGMRLYATENGRFFVVAWSYIFPVDETAARDLYGYPYSTKMVVGEQEAFGGIPDA